MVWQLFEGKDIRLCAFDADKDADVFAKWSENAEYLRMTDMEPARPLSSFQIKKRFDELDKELGRDLFFFVIRTAADDRAIGIARIFWVEWNHSAARVQVAIASPEDCHKGYGGQALEMMLRYGFEEMNLYRLGADAFEYDGATARLLERHGFTLEVRRREGVYRDGRYWDVLMYGILAAEWQARQQGAKSE